MYADDSHALKSIKAEDLRQWVDEVYTQGKKQVKLLADSGSTDVDASLFSYDEEDYESQQAPKQGGEEAHDEGSTVGSSNSGQDATSGANV